jgi:hypothetical protein
MIDDWIVSKAKYTFGLIWKIAAIISGVLEEELNDDILKEATLVGPGVYRHPKIPDLEKWCWVIYGAIRDFKIGYRFDDGTIVSGYNSFDFEDFNPDTHLCCLYDVIELIVENAPPKIPESISAVAEHIKAKKILKTKPEDINPKWENSILKVVCTFVEYTMDDHKNLADKEEVFKSRTNFRTAVEKLCGSITPKTLRKVFDSAKAIEKKK